MQLEMHVMIFTQEVLAAQVESEEQQLFLRQTVQVESLEDEGHDPVDPVVPPDPPLPPVDAAVPPVPPEEVHAELQLPSAQLR